MLHTAWRQADLAQWQQRLVGAFKADLLHCQENPRSGGFLPEPVLDVSGLEVPQLGGDGFVVYALMSSQACVCRRSVKQFNANGAEPELTVFAI